MATSAKRNGNGTEYLADPTTLFGPSQRRTKIVEIQFDESAPPIKIIVRAMNAGEKRRFLNRALLTDSAGKFVTKPDERGNPVNMPDMDWYNSGNRTKVLLALCCTKFDGTPLFPEAWMTAQRMLEDRSASTSGLADFDNIDPIAEVLLSAAASEVSLIMQADIDKVLKLPLVPRSEDSIDGQQPSVTSIPS